MGYEFPTRPACGSQDLRSARYDDHEQKVRHASSSGGQRNSGNGAREESDWATPAHDPKGHFLDFDAKGSNLQSSRELFLQQRPNHGGDSKKNGKDKRSRSRRRKGKRSSSSSSTCTRTSTDRRKTRSKKGPPAPDKDDE